MKNMQELAAISAVVALISSEENTAIYREPIRALPPSPYAAYGRQLTMQYRDITQRRIIKRTR
ncbi:MAG: hypothetical protein RBS43_00910 [Candidatus Cloacimonas sp.]|jgi:hypothetical protein|nr:hypothetical protein [Candidatus Cloacimonas sp.]